MRALKSLLSFPSLFRGISPFSSRFPFCSPLQGGKRDDVDCIKVHGHHLSSLVGTSTEFGRDQPCDDEKAIEKEAALQLALSQLVGDFDRESNLSLHRFYSTRYAPVISTGSLKLDQALGIGGLPKGRMVEIYGQEASGKTTLALHIVKEAQKLGGCCAYIDVENAMNPSLAEDMGVNIENLLITHPTSAETSLSIVNTLINSGSVDVIVVDSVAALVPQCEIDGLINLSSEEVQSRLMTQALRKIHYSLSRSKTLVIFVNQVRNKVKSANAFGPANIVTCGGNALKFYAAIRMRIVRNSLLQNKEETFGISISVQVTKNKLAPAMKKAMLAIGFGRGIFREAEILELASNHGILLREGSGYWISGEYFKDDQEAQHYLAENKHVQDELVNTLRTQLFETKA
ncbi:hypothetical protein J5N97_014398 [Dioscorea zingiberensis]|uniref:Uncharacterized protein n=1 Tax=Dioscorea zingiberensis TaxID=325984 RepID=A0A9D5CTW7_9LILI|nr:hypothetical protein J5N97_014398 [Dioscorea zingiberensis]